ncbi:MAG TPA: phosphoenolpyruvate carboxykinase domain-containing protein, partial [Dehalococcoidia bacterium]
WLMDLAEDRVQGQVSPVGILPRREELNLDGLNIPEADLQRLLNIDRATWREEMASREAHLSQFAGLPDEIWQAHRKMTAALNGG